MRDASSGKISMICRPLYIQVLIEIFSYVSSIDITPSLVTAIKHEVPTVLRVVQRHLAGRAQPHHLSHVDLGAIRRGRNLSVCRYVLTMSHTKHAYLQSYILVYLYFSSRGEESRLLRIQYKSPRDG